MKYKKNQFCQCLLNNVRITRIFKEFLPFTIKGLISECITRFSAIFNDSNVDNLFFVLFGADSTGLRTPPPEMSNSR